MDTDIHGLKSRLRAEIRSRLENISPAVRIAESIELCARLETQLQSARAILFFAPLPDELDIWLLLQKFLATKKICALPCFDSTTQNYLARRVFDLENNIITGKFGIREPASTCEEIALDKFDLVLAPGLAFDLSGNRLGRGKGFYDRILAGASGIKCGIAYEFQLLNKIPAEPHDVRMNFITTPKRCARVG